MRWGRRDWRHLGNYSLPCYVPELTKNKQGYPMKISMEVRTTFMPHFGIDICSVSN